jgi:hypothetical protein
MPEQETMRRVKRDQAEGKAATTQAGEFIREVFHHIREGKHGARSPQQAIAIGLSKARRAGVDLPPPKKGTVSEKTRKSAEHAYEAGQTNPNHKPSRTRSKAVWERCSTKASRRFPTPPCRSRPSGVAHQRTPLSAAPARKRRPTAVRRPNRASARKVARTRARRQAVS